MRFECVLVTTLCAFRAAGRKGERKWRGAAGASAAAAVIPSAIDIHQRARRLCQLNVRASAVERVL